ncbi:MAG TPA: helix-turn-helix domain-containing protein [Rhizomicrobium sp.]|nr:helix-turn-helix domain-containing protein [Rhizomicrobium sp.]
MSEACDRYVARQQWLLQVYGRPDLTPGEKLTASVIAWHQNAETGQTNPSMGTVARESAQTERGVRKHVSKLRALGLMSVDLRGRSYWYTLILNTGTTVPVSESGTVVPVSKSGHRNSKVRTPERQGQKGGTTVPPNLENHEKPLGRDAARCPKGAPHPALEALQAALGQEAFDTWLAAGKAVFEPGPPARFVLSSESYARHVSRKYAPAFDQVFGAGGWEVTTARLVIAA